MGSAPCRRGWSRIRRGRVPTVVLASAGLVLLVLSLQPPYAFAQAAAAKIRIENPWVRRLPTAATGQRGNGADVAVYLTINNQDDSADALMAATSDAARRAELHEVKAEGGATSMRPVARVDVPARGRLELKPGGYHVMLLGVTRPLNPGDRVRVTVTLEKAGSITFEAPAQ
jgi:copper(I)-binding protein